MELEKALIISFMAYPFAYAVFMIIGVFGEEAYLEMPGYPLPSDTPNLFRICAEPGMNEDVLWAVEQWNKALTKHEVPVRMQVVSTDCIARVKPIEEPMMGEFGGTVVFSPKEGINASKIPPESIGFWVFGEIQVVVWNTENVSLRRAILLHELGHLLLLNHIRDYKGFGPKPIMSPELDIRNPPQSVTDFDAYMAWLRYSFCRDKACGTFYVKNPNPPAASIAAIITTMFTTTSLVMMGRKNHVGNYGEGKD
jgi:hypothetical protein